METAYISRNEAAAMIGMNAISLKEASARGTYDEVTGPVHTTGEGSAKRYWYTKEQVEAIRAYRDPDYIRLRMLAMGGGVQTTALLLMHLKGLLDPAPDCTAFMDLGWESEETYDNVRKLQRMSEEGGLPFHWVKTESIEQALIDGAADRSVRVNAPPFYVHSDRTNKAAQITRECTGAYKINSMNKFIRNDLLKTRPGEQVRGRVEIMLGISTDEAHRISASRTGWIDNTFPLIEMGMSRTDCIKFIEDYGFRVPPKSACLGCPYRSNKEWAKMKEETPHEFAQVVQIDAIIRSGLGSVRRPLFVHSSLKPLGEVVFDKSTKEGWGNECSGMCAT